MVPRCCDCSVVAVVVIVKPCFDASGWNMAIHECQSRFMSSIWRPPEIIFSGFLLPSCSARQCLHFSSSRLGCRPPLLSGNQCFPRKEFHLTVRRINPWIVSSVFCLCADTVAVTVVITTTAAERFPLLWGKKELLPDSSWLRIFTLELLCHA